MNRISSRADARDGLDIRDGEKRNFPDVAVTLSAPPPRSRTAPSVTSSLKVILSLPEPPVRVSTASIVIVEPKSDVVSLSVPPLK